MKYYYLTLLLILVFLACQLFDCELIPDDEDITIIDSDYIFLETKSSSLPNKKDERGVFAKFDIPQDGIICEYRGPVLSFKDKVLVTVSTPGHQMFPVQGPDGLSYSIMGRDCVCAEINDCSSIASKQYTQDEILSLISNGESNCFDGFGYNAKTASESQTGKYLLIEVSY